MTMHTFLRPVLGGATASLVLFSAAMAMAAEPFPKDVTLWAELTHIDIDPELEYLQDVDAGSLVIDQRASEIVLTLRHAVHPPAHPLAPEEIRLPLVATRINACNTTYTARRDGRAYDGPLETLTVIDFQHALPDRDPRRPCGRPRAPVFISYEMVTAGFHAPVLETRSEFRADGLVRAPEVPPPRD